MDYRMQPSPMSGTPGVHLNESLNPSPVNREEAKFLRSWLVYDSDLDLNRTGGPMNWNMVLGLVVAAAVSAGLWVGAGLMIGRFWK